MVKSIARQGGESRRGITRDLHEDRVEPRIGERVRRALQDRRFIAIDINFQMVRERAVPLVPEGIEAYADHALHMEGREGTGEVVDRRPEAMERCPGGVASASHAGVILRMEIKLAEAEVGGEGEATGGDA